MTMISAPLSKYIKISRTDKSEDEKLYLGDLEEDIFSSFAFHHVYVMDSHFCDCLPFVSKIIEACQNIILRFKVCQSSLRKNVVVSFNVSFGEQLP